MTKIRIIVPAALALAGCLSPMIYAAANAAGLKATLSGTQGSPKPGDTDGSGSAEVNFEDAANRVCYNLTVSNIAPATMAHIHRGAAGASGPPVVTLEAPAKGMSKGCVDSSKAVIDEIKANPAGFYVNVHNADFPGGAIRGQLAQ